LSPIRPSRSRGGQPRSYGSHDDVASVTALADTTPLTSILSGDRLLLVGAFTGRFFVYTKSGELVASYTVPNTGEQTLVNDEAVTPTATSTSPTPSNGQKHKNTCVYRLSSRVGVRSGGCAGRCGFR
jgi:hypothetical protein